MKRINKENRPKRKLHKSTGILIAASLFIGALSLNAAYTKAHDEYEKIANEKSSTNVFSTMDEIQFDDNHFTSENLKNTKITAFNVWETSCSGCLEEMGDLEKLSKEYPDTEFQLVGICADVYDSNGNLDTKQVEKGKMLMEKSETTFTNLVPSQEMESFISKTVFGFPTTYFVDSNGKVIGSTTGSRNFESWKNKVDKIMEEQQL